MKISIDVLSLDMAKIEELNNKENKTQEDLKEGIRIFGVFSNFIDNNYKGFKKFDKNDKEEYATDIYDWNERQSSVLSDIIRFGFKKIISGDEKEVDWVIYEAWLLGYLIKKYYKKP